jgi:hypothetical protein
MPPPQSKTGFRSPPTTFLCGPQPRWPPDPIPNDATPGSHDNLAQRNLLIVELANPGSAATHTVQSTFELKPSQVALQVPQAFGAGPDPEPAKSRRESDELLIRWNDLPRSSRALLYLPDVDAHEIVATAGARNGPPVLFARDNATLLCRAQPDERRRGDRTVRRTAMRTYVRDRLETCRWVARTGWAPSVAVCCLRPLSAPGAAMTASCGARSRSKQAHAAAEGPEGREGRTLRAFAGLSPANCGDFRGPVPPQRARLARRRDIAADNGEPIQRAMFSWRPSTAAVSRGPVRRFKPMHGWMPLAA